MIWFIIISLAVWRFTHMLQNEQGPANIITKFRDFITKKDGDEFEDPDSLWTQGFLCFYCLSMWVAIPAAIFLSHNLIEFFGYWFGISAAAIFINLAHEKMS